MLVLLLGYPSFWSPNPEDCRYSFFHSSALTCLEYHQTQQVSASTERHEMMDPSRLEQSRLERLRSVVNCWSQLDARVIAMATQGREATCEGAVGIQVLCDPESFVVA